MHKNYAPLGIGVSLAGAGAEVNHSDARAINGAGGAAGFGNAGFGIVQGPPQNNWDMAISKVTKIRENQTLLFRAEFFNTFNHPQFDFPDTNASSGT